MCDIVNGLLLILQPQDNPHGLSSKDPGFWASESHLQLASKEGGPKCLWVLDWENEKAHLSLEKKIMVLAKDSVKGTSTEKCLWNSSMGQFYCLAFKGEIRWVIEKAEP